jgi:uncharacterized protein (TIGR02265 family)
MTFSSTEVGSMSTESMMLSGAGSLEWEQDLLWKMYQAMPEDTVRGVSFNGTLEAVEALGGEEVARECLRVAGEEKFLDYYSYPIRSLLRMLYCAAKRLGPRFGGGEVVLRRLSRHANADFLSSLVGKAALLLAYGSPWRMMDMAPQLYRQISSFGERTVAWTGRRSGRFLLRGDLLPAACHEGALEAFIQAAGGREVRVVRRWVEGLDGEYAFSWE